MFMCLLSKSQVKSRKRENYLSQFEWIQLILFSKTGLIHYLWGEGRD